jgi:predicted acylesterase/phospholipase RssA
MTTASRWYICTAAALFAAPLILPSQLPFACASAAAQSMMAPARPPVAPPRHDNHANPQPTTPPAAATPPAAVAQPKQLPPRIPFTAADDAAAVIPGMPDARFFADSVADYTSALPAQPGPWLILSSGGEDGAFGAGFLNGLSAGGKRPDYAVVTGVSAGALLAPFAFAGSRYDGALHDVFTKITAADIFEVGNTGESFVDTWPLKDLIAKQITPALLADVAAAHNSGRRLFIVTTDLDAGRSVVWNMGAIAAHGGDAALKLFRSVMLASSAIPGGFPPVLIDVEANGKKFQEMHVDGGVGGQFFVAPAALMASTSDYRLPATELDIVINTVLQPEFEVVQRATPSILGQTVSTAVKVDTQLMLDRTYLAAKRSGVAFNVATIPAGFNAPSRGPFDPDFMGALFQTGYDLGKSAAPFADAPPPYAAQPIQQTQDPEKTGANR